MTLARLASGILLFSAAVGAEQPDLPHLGAPLPQTQASHAFLSSAHLKKPLDLSRYGYVEEEYLISGQARVFDRSTDPAPKVLAQGPYTTRILVRRPRDLRRFNGTAIVEPFNPSTAVDLPIMWAESHQQMLADGYAWVGITIKPNTIASLKKFDPARYGSVAMSNPAAGPRCDAAAINSWSQPTTPSDETGLCRIWWRDKERADAWIAKHPTCTLMPLYAAPPSPPAAQMREALRHAQVRFECLADEFEKAGDTASWAMCRVDAGRMFKALSADTEQVRDVYPRSRCR